MPPETPSPGSASNLPPVSTPAAPQQPSGGDTHSVTALEEAYGRALTGGGFKRGGDGKFQSGRFTQKAAPEGKPSEARQREGGSAVAPARDAPGDGAAPPQEAPSGEGEEQQEPAEPPAPADDGDGEAPIEPPASWSHDKHELFSSLPREAQEIIAQRERERDVELRRGQNGSADARKALEAERAALSTERQQLAQRAVRFATEAEAKFMREWGHVQSYEELATDDYVRFNQSLDKVRYEYQQLNDLRAQIEAESYQQLVGFRAEQDRAYRAEMKLADDAKWQSHMGELYSYWQKNGLTEKEMAQASQIHLGIMRDARLYRESKHALEQARANASTTAAPTRVQAPGAARSANRKDGVAAALMQRVRTEGSTSALEAAFQHALDKGNRHATNQRNVR